MTLSINPEVEEIVVMGPNFHNKTNLASTDGLRKQFVEGFSSWLLLFNHDLVVAETYK